MPGSLRSLGEQTSSAALSSGPTRLAAIQVLTDGTNDATVICYDNTAASGTKVFEAVVAGANDSELFEFPKPVKCKTALYVSISGTGASCIPYVG